jgi:hypothetical protein
VQKFNWFNSIMIHFRNSFMVTNNMSTYVNNLIAIVSLSENKHIQLNRIGHNIISNHLKFSHLPQKFVQQPSKIYKNFETQFGLVSLEEYKRIQPQS